MANTLFTLFNVTAYIGTAFSSSWTYSELGEGLDNVEEALNEVVQQYTFLNGNGFAKNHVTGMAPAWTFSGKRVQGDPAQDYIFGKKYKIDTDRASSFKLVVVDNSSGSAVTSTLTVPCTICNIVEFSGAATDDSAISFEVRFDGEPSIDAGDPDLGVIAVNSVAGSEVGDTKVTVSPATGILVYETGASASTPEYLDVLSDWTPFVNGADYTVATGQYFTVAEVDNQWRAVALGNAIVVAKA